jgi:hypothetical protein
MNDGNPKSMINGDPPKPGPNAGRKARKVGSARARRCFRWARLACCTAGAQNRPSAGASGECRMKTVPSRAHREAAEAKRLEARRGFLLGSGAALLAPVTMSPGRVGAVTYSECAAGMDWMTMSLEARNLAYNNVAHVGPDFARQKTESWAAASKALREQRPKHLNLAYAPGERTKWDLYPATDPKAPCFVHIHGGYWQRGSREIFACLAEGALAHGLSAALPGYTLAPEANLTQITNELRTAFDWLEAEAAEHPDEAGMKPESLLLLIGLLFGRQIARGGAGAPLFDRLGHLPDRLWHGRSAAV